MWHTRVCPPSWATGRAQGTESPQRTLANTRCQTTDPNGAPKRTCPHGPRATARRAESQHSTPERPTPRRPCPHSRAPHTVHQSALSQRTLTRTCFHIPRETAWRSGLTHPHMSTLPSSHLARPNRKSGVSLAWRARGRRVMGRTSAACRILRSYEGACPRRLQTQGAAERLLFAAT